MKKAPNAAEFLNEVDPSPEVRNLKAQNAACNKAIDDLKVHIGKLEAFEGRLLEAVQSLPPPKKMAVPNPKMGHAESEALLCLSDVHAEEYVDAEEMEGYAKYDWEIFLARMWMCMEKTVEITNIMRQAGPVKKLRLLALGDMLTGEIHDELARSNTFDLPVAVVKVGHVLGQAVNLLSAHYDEIECSCVCGNHGRQDMKPCHKGRADRNWDTAVYRIASLLTASNPRVKWNIPRSPSYIVHALGAKLLIKHGDGIMMTSTTPFYGLARDTAQEHSKRKKGENFDWLIQGHLHVHDKIEERILAPSMIGTSQFAYNRLHSVSDPAQLLLFSTDQSDLGITCQWPIMLKSAEGHKFTSV